MPVTMAVARRAAAAREGREHHRHPVGDGRRRRRARLPDHRPARRGLRLPRVFLVRGSRRGRRARASRCSCFRAARRPSPRAGSTPSAPALLCVALAIFIVVLSEAETWGWASARVHRSARRLGRPRRRLGALRAAPPRSAGRPSAGASPDGADRRHRRPHHLADDVPLPADRRGVRAGSARASASASASSVLVAGCVLVPAVGRHARRQPARSCASSVATAAAS